MGQPARATSVYAVQQRDPTPNDALERFLITPNPLRVGGAWRAPRGARLGRLGPPLVLLAGLQDVAHGFDDIAPHFTDDHHVLAITRRGYGASSQPRSGYDLASRVADLHAVLDSLRLPRVALVGHSIAGDELTAFAGGIPIG